MKKSLITLVVIALVASLAIPVAAAAKGGPQGRGNSGAAQEHKAEQAAAKQERTQARVAAKQERTAQKQQAQEERRAAREFEAEDADETSPSADASPSVDTTKAVGPGVENALARITRNIERKLAKVGFDGMLPPGLMRVWLRFSTWLGHDTTVTPWTPPVSTDTSDTAPPSGDTSPTPPPGEDTSPSVDPSAPVVPVAP